MHLLNVYLAKGWIFAGQRKISFSLKLHLVKELPPFCKLQNNEQEVRRVNHILKQWYGSAWGGGRIKTWNTSKLMIQGWLTDWRIRTSFKTDVELQRFTTYHVKKEGFQIKIYLIPPLNVVAVVFLQIILIATLIGRFQLQNLPQKNTFSDQPRDQKYLCRSGILKPSLTSPQAPLPRTLLT